MTTATVFSMGSPDILIDVVSDGLIRLLGRDKVHVDFNRVRSQDSMKAQFLENFGGPNSVDFYDTDLLVLSNRTTIDRIDAWRSKTGKHRVVVIDGEDDPWIRDNYLRAADVYFKREYLTTASHPPKVRPLPFGAIPEKLPEPAVGPRSGIFFRFKETDPMRRHVADCLQRNGFPLPGDLLAKDHYNQDLCSKLIGVSVRGAGWDTYRYWEVPYFGAALVSQRMPIRIAGNLVEDSEAIFFDTVDEFWRKTKALLDDPARAEAIAQRGRQAIMTRHLSTHRATTVLEAVL